MKKKVIIGISIIAIVVLIIVIFFIVNNITHSDNYIISKCQLCNEMYKNSNTAIPKICSSCADITGRCMQCGKLKK